MRTNASLDERACALAKVRKTHQLRNEVALMQLDLTLSEQIDAFLSSLSKTEEGRAAAERIEQTGMV